MKVTVLPIVLDAHGIILKSLENRLVEREIRERIETIQITVFMRSLRILRRVLETRKYLLSLRLQ